MADKRGDGMQELIAGSQPQRKEYFAPGMVTIRCVVCGKKLLELPPSTQFRIRCPRCKELHLIGPSEKSIDKDTSGQAG